MSERPQPVTEQVMRRVLRQELCLAPLPSYPPPLAQRSERLVLASVLDGRVLRSGYLGLQPDDFAEPLHRAIWASTLTDPGELCSELYRDGWTGDLSQVLADLTLRVAAVHVDQLAKHAANIIESANCRRLLLVLGAIDAEVRTGKLGYAQARARLRAVAGAG